MMEFLAHQRGPVPAQTIATALGLPRSSVYQILTVLTERGFALHIPEERRYGLGPAAFELSSAYSRQQPLTRLGAPLLAKLVDHIGESAHLAVLHGTDVLYVVEERAARRPSLITDVGVRLPAHLTASGRALLSALPPAQLRALYSESVVFTQRAELGSTGPTSYRELKTLVTAAHQLGYSTERGEITPGLASVGVVVKDHMGWPAAAIAVTFSDPGFPDQKELDDKIQQLIPEVSSTAAELSRRIHGAH
jgi:DNA-binding IclR family transcriptional regulator